MCGIWELKTKHNVPHWVELVQCEFFLVVAVIRTPDLAYIMHCHQLS